MSLKHEPSSEPLHIPAKWLFLNPNPQTLRLAAAGMNVVVFALLIYGGPCMFQV